MATAITVPHPNVEGAAFVPSLTTPMALAGGRGAVTGAVPDFRGAAPVVLVGDVVGPD